MPRGATGRAALAVAALTLALPAAAQAAGPPQLGAAWTAEVSSASVTFHGEIDPEGSSTAYRFEYETEAAWQANPPSEPFKGASKAPISSFCPGAVSNGCAGEGNALVSVSQHVSVLKATTTYRYRLTATNSEGSEALETNPSGQPLAFATQPLGAVFSLPDSRGWELVSPPDKNGGAVQGPEQNHGGGAIQAAASGPASLTYTSASAFEEPQGAPQASQYISTRSGSGWATENITTPVLSGSYGSEPNGVPYQLFSPGLERALLLNGEHCRGEGSGCPVANPPLPGSGAPEGFQDYYLRDNTASSFGALLTEANDGFLSLSSSQFSVALAGASPDLRHVVLSTCAKLTTDATEVAGSEGCDPEEPNLYEWSGGALSLVNLLPGESQGTPGARLAAQGSAVSTDGSRVYFTDRGTLYLREGALIVQVDEAQGGGGEFEAATPLGEVAFFAKAGHLYRFADHEDLLSTIDLTPAGGVVGVLGISADGQSVFFQDASGLERWHEGTTTTVAAGPQAALQSDWPPTTGTSRVSADGSELLFLSKAPLTNYDNTDQASGQPDPEVYLWSTAGGLACLSCNPTGERPAGPSTIPGTYANGEEGRLAPGQILTDSYKPRALSVDGRRAFFTSEDAIAPLDTNRASDAYQWEASGEGSCAKAGGCASLISSGTDPLGASFLDASGDGSDAYFLTSASLTEPPNLPHVTVTPEGNTDSGSADAYDARVGGGFAEPARPIPCEADECAPLPVEPEDPTVGTLVPGVGNPPVHFPKPPCKRGFVRVHGKCVKKPHHRHHHGKGGHK